LISLASTICAGEDSNEQLSPISANQILSVRIYGPPTRRYEPLIIGDAFGRDRINKLYSFFPELGSPDSAKGIPRVENKKKNSVEKARTNRVVLQLRSKVNGSYDVELQVLEAGSTWICGGKCFSMKEGWAEFLATEFTRQEKDYNENGYPKPIHVDEENAETIGIRVQIGRLPSDGYSRFNHRQFHVYLKPELAADFEHSFLGYFRGDEYLLGAAANSRKMDDGQLRLTFNVNPTIAKDVGFRIQIAQKPRPILYRFDLPSFLRVDKTSNHESPKVRLVGKWVGTADEDIRWVATFEFPGIFKMVGTHPARPRRETLRVIGTYKVDSSVRPTQLKIEALGKHSDGQYKGNVIVEMIDENRFRISNPSVFSPKAFDKRSFVMQRQDAADLKTALEVEAQSLRKPIKITTPRIIKLLETANLAHISTRHDQTILIRLHDGTEYRGKYRQPEAGQYADDEHLFDIYNLFMHIRRSRDDLKGPLSISTE
jgi:hypothetical protein